MWCCGALVLWCSGAVVLGCCGVAVLWCYGAVTQTHTYIGKNFIHIPMASAAVRDCWTF